MIKLMHKSLFKILKQDKNERASENERKNISFRFELFHMPINVYCFKISLRD